MSDYPNNNFYKQTETTVRFHKATYCAGFCVPEYGKAVLVVVDDYAKSCPYCNSGRVIHEQIKPKNYQYSLNRLLSNDKKLKARYSL